MAAKCSVITWSVSKLGGGWPRYASGRLKQGKIYKETRQGEQKVAADREWQLILSGR